MDRLILTEMDPLGGSGKEKVSLSKQGDSEDSEQEVLSRDAESEQNQVSLNRALTSDF